MEFLKKILKGPEIKSKKPFHKRPTGVFEWEEDGNLDDYWDYKDKPLENRAQRCQKEFPQPEIMYNEEEMKKFCDEDDDIIWDNSWLYQTQPEWTKKSGKNNNPTHSENVTRMPEIDYLPLDINDPENNGNNDEPFHFENMNPYFKATPYYVNQRPIDDGIDYYKRNDIRNRPSMKTSDFLIQGQNREPNLNRRFANMRADIESSFVPSRWKHDRQSVMPLEQHQKQQQLPGGKLYLPGEGPTAEDPLAVDYRPTEKTYEELHNRTTVEAPGRINMGLMGEKQFRQEKLHHLKRHDVNDYGFYNFDGYSRANYDKLPTRPHTTGKRKNRIRPEKGSIGNAEVTVSKPSTRGKHRKKPENKVMPEFEHIAPGEGNVKKGSAHGKHSGKSKTKIMPEFDYYSHPFSSEYQPYNGRVEGFDNRMDTNRGQGKDTLNTWRSSHYLPGKGKIVHGKNSKSKTRKKYTEHMKGHDKGLNYDSQRMEGFDYTLYEPWELKEEKLFAVWNSRQEGNMQSQKNNGPALVTKEQLNALRQNKKQHYVENMRENGNFQSRKIAHPSKSKNDSFFKDGLISKSEIWDKTKAPKYSETTANRGNRVTGKNTRKQTKQSQYEILPDNTNIQTTNDRGNRVTGKNTRKSTLKSEYEENVRSKGYIETGRGRKGRLRGKITSNKHEKKSFIETLANRDGNIETGQNRGEGYKIVQVEPRETLRSKTISYAGNGFHNSGILSHDGVKNIEWHRDRNKKQHTATRGFRANHPLQGDLGLGSDQIKVDLWQKKKKEVPGQVINPQSRSHHAPRYGNEGIVSRQGRQHLRKKERAPRDGINTEFGFIKPMYDKRGRRRKFSRSASREAKKIKPVML